jgi:hypothetical protein
MKTRFLFSVFTGGVLFWLLAFSQINLSGRAYFDQLFLVVTPLVSISFLAWLAFPYLAGSFSHPVRTAALIAIVPASIHLSIQHLVYPYPWHSMVFMATGVLLYGSVIHLWRDSFQLAIRENFIKTPFNLLTLGSILLFPAGVLHLASLNPVVFNPSDLLLPVNHLPWIGVGILLGILTLGPFTDYVSQLLSAELRGRVCIFIEENLPGVFAFFIFFFSYFALARGFNPPIDAINLNNTFFAADSSIWQVRIGSAEGSAIGRAVHPLVLFLRFPAWLLSILYNGNWHLAALILITMTGAASVFLLWRFVFSASKNSTYALVFSGIFGISASHVVFASVTETYVFSAFGLLLFFVLLQSQKHTPSQFIPAGLLTIGITVSNFAQSTISFFLIRRNMREWLAFTSVTLTASVTLTLLSNLIYPGWVTYFFSPSDLLMENKFTGLIQNQPVLERATLLGKNLFLYNVVAPSPMQRVMDKEDRPPFPKFNFLYTDASLVEYRGHYYALPALASWLMVLIGSFAVFIWKRKTSPFWDFQITALTLVAFNFLLHLDYGFEPFLYTENWTYALVVFAALSLHPFSRRIWMHILLTVTFVLLMLNNLAFLRILGKAIEPFLQ